MQEARNGQAMDSGEKEQVIVGRAKRARRGTPVECHWPTDSVAESVIRWNPLLRLFLAPSLTALILAVTDKLEKGASSEEVDPLALWLQTKASKRVDIFTEPAEGATSRTKAL